MDRAVAPVLGTITGLLLSDRMGLPVWASIIVISVSLLFGILASMGRDGEGRVTPRQAAFNGGALWIMACSLVFHFELSVPLSAIAALIIGLMGPSALDRAEKLGALFIEWLFRRLSGEAGRPMTRDDVAEMLGEERNRTQAAISERAVGKGQGDEPQTDL